LRPLSQTDYLVIVVRQRPAVTSLADGGVVAGDLGAREATYVVNATSIPKREGVRVRIITYVVNATSMNRTQVRQGGHVTLGHRRARRNLIPAPDARAVILR